MRDARALTCRWAGSHAWRLLLGFAWPFMVSAQPIQTASGSILPAGDSSMMFRGGLAHSGVYAGRPLRSTPRVIWKFQTEGRVISTPAVSATTVYLGSTDGKVYAVDRTTGVKKWEFATEGRVASSPAVAAGLVFIGSYDGAFYALDAATGALRWKFQTAGERRYAGRHLHGSIPAGEVMPDPFDLYLSSPAVWRGTVYIGSGDGHVYALDAITGAVRWTFKTGDVVHASPAIANGTVYIGSWDRWFYALDAITGRLRWRFQTGDDQDLHNQIGIQASAAVVDGVVYFGCRDAHLYALDAKTGKKKWSYDAGGAWINSSPAVREGKVFVGTGDGREFLELDAKTGGRNWAQVFSWYFFASPAIVGDMAYIGNWDGRLFGIDLARKAVAWTFQTDSSARNMARFIKPDSSMNFRAARSEPYGFYDGLVVALDRIFTMGSFVGSPVVLDGVLYVGSMDGAVYAMR
jgi:outer membrane protein assembly factor BamB